MEVNVKSVSSATVAQCLGCTARHVRKLREDGIVVAAGKRGRYDLPESIKNYYRPKLESPIANEQLKGLQLDNEKKEQELARDRGDLVPAADYLVALEICLTGIAKSLEALPDNLTRVRNDISDEELSETKKCIATCQGSLAMLMKNKGKEPALSGD